MYRLLQSLDYQKSRALAEFIDNSIQSYKDNRDKLKAIAGNAGHLVPEILINAYSSKYVVVGERKSIIIEDKAGGISREHLPNAIKPARVNPNRSARGLGEFGIGMKSAAIWFSNRWIIKTSSVGERGCFSLEFNLNKLIKEDRSLISVQESAVMPNQHGTKIKLIDTDRSIEDIDDARKLLLELKEIFLLFIRKKEVKIRLFFDGEEVFCKEEGKYLHIPEPLSAKRYNNKNQPEGEVTDWHTKVSLNVGNKKAKGFVMIREKGSYKFNAGLRLFKNNRLIEGTNGKPYLPENIFETTNKYGRQRIYGELHLDDFRSDFSKSGFVDRLMPKFHHEFRGYLHEKGFIDQAKNYRSRGEKRDDEKPTGKKRQKRQSPLQQMLSDLENLAEDLKLQQLVKEMISILRKVGKREIETPILIAIGLRSVLEKSLYHAAMNRGKIYRKSDKPPMLYDLIKNIKNKDSENRIIQKKYKSLFSQLEKSEVIKFLNMATHNSYIPSHRDIEIFAVNYSDLIISLHQNPDD